MTAAFPYCSVAELKAQMGKTSASTDAVLSALIISASVAIDRYCNRPDGFRADGQSSDREFAGSGRGFQFIDEAAEVVTVWVKESLTSDTYTLWASADWIKARGEVKRPTFGQAPYDLLLVDPNGSHSVFTSGRHAARAGFRPDRSPREYGLPTVKVRANWGYSLDIPPAIKQACMTMAARWFKRGESAWSDVLASGETGQLMYRQMIDPDVKFLLTAGRYVRQRLGAGF